MYAVLGIASIPVTSWATEYTHSKDESTRDDTGGYSRGGTRYPWVRPTLDYRPRSAADPIGTDVANLEGSDAQDGCAIWIR
jgi:hypothetical protein